MAQSSIAGYDITQDPTAPTLLFNPDGGGGDGETGVYVPQVTEVEGGYQISWTNNAGLQNPDPVTILNGTDGANGTDGVAGADGITYTPSVTPVTNGYMISWSNDGDLQNPPTITISNGINGVNGEDGKAGEDGLTYTPVMTPVTDGYQLSWINDGTAENPQPVVILNGSDGDAGATGTTYTPHVESVSWADPELGAMSGYDISWTNDGGLQNPDTVRITNGIRGDKGDTGDQGTTFTPIVTPATNGYTISWTNDGGLQNPDPVTITNGTVGESGTDGTTYTPTITPVTGGYELSWTNNGGYQNPGTITILNGLPSGGTTASVLIKASDIDGDVEWGGDLSTYVCKAHVSTPTLFGYAGQLDVPYIGGATASSILRLIPWGETSGTQQNLCPAVVPLDGVSVSDTGKVMTMVGYGSGSPLWALSSPRYVPSDGSEGQVLTKTTSGYEWSEASTPSVSIPQVDGRDLITGRYVSGDLSTILMARGTPSALSHAVALTTPSGTYADSFVSVPTDGTTGQVLTKSGSGVGDISWMDLPSSDSLQVVRCAPGSLTYVDSTTVRVVYSCSIVSGHTYIVIVSGGYWNDMTSAVATDGVRGYTVFDFGGAPIASDLDYSYRTVSGLIYGRAATRQTHVSSLSGVLTARDSYTQAHLDGILYPSYTYLQGELDLDSNNRLYLIDITSVLGS